MQINMKTLSSITIEDSLPANKTLNPNKAKQNLQKGSHQNLQKRSTNSPTFVVVVGHFGGEANFSYIFYI